MSEITKPRRRRVPQPKSPCFVDNVIDKIVMVFGTWQMFIIHVVWFAGWLLFGLEIHNLTFWVSLEAILLSLLILISQQSQSEHDRLRAQADLEIDRTAEKQTRILIEMVKELGGKNGIKEFKVEPNSIKDKA